MPGQVTSVPDLFLFASGLFLHGFLFAHLPEKPRPAARSAADRGVSLAKRTESAENNPGAKENGPGTLRFRGGSGRGPRVHFPDVFPS